MLLGMITQVMVKAQVNLLTSMLLPTLRPYMNFPLNNWDSSGIKLFFMDKVLEVDHP